MPATNAALVMNRMLADTIRLVTWAEKHGTPEQLKAYRALRDYTRAVAPAFDTDGKLDNKLADDKLADLQSIIDSAE